MIKPLYGLISDFVPLLGYRRLSYLLLLNFMVAAAFLYLSGMTQPGVAMYALFLTGLGVAASDVIVDALMVESGRETGRTRLFQGVQWFCISVAGIGSGFLGSWICAAYDPPGALRIAALVSAILPMVVAIMTLWCVQERKSRINLPELKASAAGFAAALRSPRLWAVAGFLIVINLNPGMVTAMYTHLKENVYLDESFLAVMDAYSSIGYAVGALLFLLFLTRRLPTQVSIAIGLLAFAVSSLPYYFITNKTSAIAAAVSYGIGYMMANLAALSLAAEACPRRSEGFVFAGLMAINNIAMKSGDRLGSQLYVGPLNRHIAPLITLSIGLTLLGLVILPLLPKAKEETGQADAVSHS
jgi:MFS family permease